MAFMYRPSYVSINLQKLRSNFRFLQSLKPGSGFHCPMIKANAYGHGDLEVAKALESEGCQFFGVSSVEEGLRLREEGIAARVLAFGFYGSDGIQELLRRSITPVVSNLQQLDLLAQMAKTPTPIHLKFDTGMHRLGFKYTECGSIQKFLARNNNLVVEALCTHFHSGDNIHDPSQSSAKQLKEFQSAREAFPDVQILHAYNSPALSSLFDHDMELQYGIRPGLLVYGIAADTGGKINALISPVMELKSKIVSVQQVKSGQVVSYGGTWQAQRDSLVGIVPLGYADGVCRSLSNKGHFLVYEQRVPILGKVCMDYTMVDLTDLNLTTTQVLGQEVVLFGKQGREEISIHEVSANAGRVHYEIVTGISERVPRVYGEPD